MLERAYATIRAAEQTIDVDHLDPRGGDPPAGGAHLRPPRVAPGLHPLVSIENIHRAKHISGRRRLRRSEHPGHRADRADPGRGRREGSFTRDIDAVDLHMMISAFCVFRVANRHTFGAIFDRDLLDPDLRERYRRCSATWSWSTWAPATVGHGYGRVRSGRGQKAAAAKHRPRRGRLPAPERPSWSRINAKSPCFHSATHRLPGGAVFSPPAANWPKHAETGLSLDRQWSPEGRYILGACPFWLADIGSGTTTQGSRC